MKRAALALLCACGTSTPPPAPSCTVELTGDIAAESALASCASVASDDAGGSTLVVDTTTAALGRVHVSVDVSSEPTGGASSPETASAWDAIEIGLGDAGCAYQAGSDVVPHGTFSLDWTNDGGSAHGALDVTLIVHAPPGSSCGPSDVEYLQVTF